MIGRKDRWWEEGEVGSRHLRLMATGRRRDPADGRSVLVSRGELLRNRLFRIIHTLHSYTHHTSTHAPDHPSSLTDPPIHHAGHDQLIHRPHIIPKQSTCTAPTPLCHGSMCHCVGPHATVHRQRRTRGGTRGPKIPDAAEGIPPVRPEPKPVRRIGTPDHAGSGR